MELNLMLKSKKLLKQYRPPPSVLHIVNPEQLINQKHILISNNIPTQHSPIIRPETHTNTFADITFYSQTIFNVHFILTDNIFV